MRLHGRPDRRIEQPDLGRRHPLGARHLADPRALFRGASGDETKALVAFALFVTAIIFGVATISNNNLQDLKTGQLVEATPWRQQVALVLGVVFGALVIPPILDLMNTAFTFQGAPGRQGQPRWPRRRPRSSRRLRRACSAATSTGA